MGLVGFNLSSSGPTGSQLRDGDMTQVVNGPFVNIGDGQLDDNFQGQMVHLGRLHVLRLIRYYGVLGLLRPFRVMVACPGSGRFFFNKQPWITKDLEELLNKTKEAFRQKDKEHIL